MGHGFHGYVSHNQRVDQKKNWHLGSSGSIFPWITHLSLVGLKNRQGLAKVGPFTVHTRHPHRKHGRVGGVDFEDVKTGIKTSGESTFLLAPSLSWRRTPITSQCLMGFFGTCLPGISNFWWLLHAFARFCRKYDSRLFYGFINPFERALKLLFLFERGCCFPAFLRSFLHLVDHEPRATSHMISWSFWGPTSPATNPGKRQTLILLLKNDVHIPAIHPFFHISASLMRYRGPQKHRLFQDGSAIHFRCPTDSIYLGWLCGYMNYSSNQWLVYLQITSDYVEVAINVSLSKHLCWAACSDKHCSSRCKSGYI